MNKKGSILGGTLLIAGSCIGAGMLGLPIVTGLVGFVPSLILFILAWAFMTVTGLLLVEANGWFEGRVNLLTMMGHSLGKWGRGLTWILYLFLFYSLLIAYISGSGNLFSSILGKTIPDWAGSLFFVVLFGWVVYLGTRQVDLWNRALMAGKIATYIGLVFLGIKYIQPQLLAHSDINYALLSLPILVISFGYHNMIPTLTSYMQGDLRRVKISIVIGGLFALIVYLIWDVIALGIIPIDTIVSSLKLDKEASQAIAEILGSSWVSSFAQGLAFFAILTSFLAQALSLVHFLSDGFKINYKKRENPWICSLALLPPLVMSILYPQLFFKALNFGGGVCAVILFGILPASLVWIGRYKKESKSAYTVPGGRLTLLVVAFFSLFILFFQLSSMFGAKYIPT